MVTLLETAMLCEPTMKESRRTFHLFGATTGNVGMAVEFSTAV